MKEHRNGPWALLAFAAFVLWPQTASADAGLPMIVLIWPASWLAFVPIVVVEAAVARRMLRFSWRDAGLLSLVANAWSTIVGIPLTWVGMLVVEWVAVLGVQPLPASAHWVALPFMAPWFLPTAKGWDVFAAAAVLCVPFYFVSFRIEARSACRRVSREDAMRWAKVANLFTYGPITLALVAAAVVAWFHR